MNNIIILCRDLFVYEVLHSNQLRPAELHRTTNDLLDKTSRVKQNIDSGESDTPSTKQPGGYFRNATYND